MLRPPRTAAVLVALVVLGLLGSTLGAPAQAAHDGPPSGGPAPAVVYGRDGYLFFGPDFDQACVYGAHLRQGFRHLAELAATIAASGRRVIFTVAPNKSEVTTAELPRHAPRGSCASRGLRAQQQLLDTFPSLNYLPVRAAVAADRRQVFWRTDPHWTPIGGSDYSQALAKRLRPTLAARQQFVRGKETQLGLFNQTLGLTTLETAPIVRPAHPGTVTSDPSSSQWSGIPRDGSPPIVVDHSWTTARKAGPYLGRTVLIGDSFTLYALGTLRPLFRHGRFLWIDHVSVPTMVHAVHRASTVVIEVAQFMVQHSDLGSPGLRQAMAAGLG